MREADPPPEQLDSESTAERTAAARSRAEAMIRRIYHLGQDVVEVGSYRETLPVAMARWEHAVSAGADPIELTERMALVRVVSDFPADEALTVSTYLGPDRHATRELCLHEWLKRQPTHPELPTVDVDPPAPTDPEESRARQRRDIDELRRRA